jgi:hypothetical protein
MKTMRAPHAHTANQVENKRNLDLKWFYPIIHPTTPSPTIFDPLRPQLTLARITAENWQLATQKSP